MENSLLRLMTKSLSSAFLPCRDANSSSASQALRRLWGSRDVAVAHLVLGFVCVQVSIFVVPDDGSRRQLVQELNAQTHEEDVVRDFPRQLAQSGAERRRLTVPLVFCSSLVDTIV